MRVGICGYPGSGKSTVFEALAPGTAAEKGGIAYGNIKVPDRRIDRLAAIFAPKRNVYAEITFMDVGGGGRADTGAFPPEVVQNMRNADVLVHVVRGFDNPMVGRDAEPEADRGRLDDELVLIDQTVLDRRQDRWRREARKGQDVEINDRALAWLEEGKPLRSMGLTEEEIGTFTGIQLLSLTPMITLFNLSEEAWADAANAALRETHDAGDNEVSMAICGALEAEIAGMSGEDQLEFLEGLGLGEPARDTFIRAAYRLLDLISFLTAGPDECRAWPIRRGLNARRAAGKVHSDIERGFIRAEVYTFEDLIVAGSEAALKSVGKIRLEGKEYVVRDGDVCNFRFNV